MLSHQLVLLASSFVPVLASPMAMLVANTTGGSTANPNTASTASADYRNSNTFDYVIIGGGTAGLTLAARLVANPRVTVAVIEAGGFYEKEYGNGSWIPALAPAQDTATDPSVPTINIDWGFISEPQSGLNNRKLHYARGKCLGGSSARNLMVYHRGTKGTYQQWATKVGDNAYTWDNMFPYLRKSCDFTPPDTSKRQANSTPNYDSTAFYPEVGPLQVSYPNWGSPFGTWGMKGMQSLGLTENPELNNGVLVGSAWAPDTINPADEHRSSSETSFLQSVAEKPNLKVYTHSMAKKILFSGTTATGVLVNCTDTKSTFTLTANKEVILSAGAIQSPQMLMVSGIGPSATLKKYNIPVVANLAGVGQNLQDHALAGVTFRVNVETMSRYVDDPVYAAKADNDYNTNQTGQLTSPSGPVAFQKISTNSSATLSSTTRSALASTFASDWPEIEYLFSDAFPGPDPNDGYNYATIYTANVAPFSKGYVSISSADANVPPVFDLALLSDSRDMEVFLAGYKRSRQIFAAVPQVVLGAEVLPGATANTDAALTSYIRANAGAVWHASGSCAMGKSTDKNAVVDTHGRVYGVKKLRVVDASIFPFVLPGHPQSTVYGLAEKIYADIVAGK